MVGFSFWHPILQQRLNVCWLSNCNVIADVDFSGSACSRNCFIRGQSCSGHWSQAPEQRRILLPCPTRGTQPGWNKYLLPQTKPSVTQWRQKTQRPITAASLLSRSWQGITSSSSRLVKLRCFANTFSQRDSPVFEMKMKTTVFPRLNLGRREGRDYQSWQAESS